MTIGGDYTQFAGQLDVAETVTRTLTVSGNFSVSAGFFVLINGATVGATTNIAGNAAISGTGAIVMEGTSSSGVAILAVTGNFTATSTSTAIVDMGTGTVTGNEFRIAGNFSNRERTLLGPLPQVLRLASFLIKRGHRHFHILGATSQYTQYTVNSGSSLQMLTGLVIGTEQIRAARSPSMAR